ncbi:MAG: hypothetical protein EHM85_00310 [Desulfobacteraceae bacterium]|nr:MAG: hypothetical protein EHM85_17285 [Desulfobacteraceae bacterium]RPH53080.1 MAG: hypothetical protein EHM85_00310 [Desulfobacteraceae bacterium]
MYDKNYEPIETYYRGYRFRSRLEARWAVFFEHMGITFQYEPEGYKLPSGWYLPDFWLPQVKMWAEVKPNEFTRHEYSLAFDLSKLTGFSFLMLDGPPDFRPYKSVSVAEGIEENGKLIWDDIDVSYCLVSFYLEEGRFYYLDQGEQKLDDYGNDYKEAVYAAREQKFDSPKNLR